MAIARHRNVTKAAKELHISQPSVSLQIKVLEKEYGLKLYEKNSKEIQLTQNGQRFIDSAQQILMQVDNLGRESKGIFRPSKTGSLTVGGGFYASVTFLPLVLKAFKKKHPDVRLCLETEATQDIEELVLQSKIDVAVIIKPAFYPTVVYEPYREEELVAVVSADHPLARRRKLAPRELADVLVVTKMAKKHPSLMDQISSELGRQGHTMNIALQCESPAATMAAIKSGMGLGFLFREHVQADIKRGELKAIQIPGINMKFKTYIIYPKDRALSLYARDFLTLLRQRPQKSVRSRAKREQAVGRSIAAS